MNLFEICQYTFIFFIISIFLAIIIAVVIKCIISISGGKYSVPYVPSTKRLVQLLVQKGKIKEGDKIIDLGSGTGEIVFNIAREKSVEITGIEINWILHFISKIKNIFIQTNSKIKFVRGNLLEVNLGKYDKIVFFITPDFIQKFLLQKIEKEISPCTMIISNTFKLDLNNFTEEFYKIGKGGLGKQIYIYKKKRSKES